MKSVKIRIVIFSFVWLSFFSVQTFAFDLDSGNAAAEIVIPSAIPAIFEVSPTGGDAPLVLRFTTLLTNSWFDASAAYHPTAVGVYSSLGRRPATENTTNRNVNIALLYASYHVLNSLFPARQQEWRAMLMNIGLNPNDTSTDRSSPIGLGNLAGAAVVAARERDGMNQLGDEGGRTFNRMAYADYLGYAPVNTAYQLVNPSRWQPAIVSPRTGIYRVQQFVTPQLRKTKPYSVKNPKRFRAPFPYASQIENIEDYAAQADEVLTASAAMTDQQKMVAELFDNKIFSLGFSALFASQSQGLSLLDFIHYDFLTNMAAFDTAIIIWKEKHRYDAVRPFSAIAHIYGDQPVTAWGGVGKGTVNNLPANQWTSYLPVADHPEYPSASASFCAAHAEASRLFLGTDTLGFVVPKAQGSSMIEPGITPATDIELVFDTWSDLEHQCGISRLWSGVHFKPSIPAGQALGHKIAKRAHRFLKRKIAGKQKAK